MKNSLAVTFFMLVTEPDIMIAQYAINSFRLLQRSGMPFHLIVYGNCLLEKTRAKWYPKWEKLSYVSVEDNIAICSKSNVFRGRRQILDGEWQHFQEGPYEGAADIWKREVQDKASQFETPLVALVDSDFEILSADFVLEALARLNNNPHLGGVSAIFDEEKTDFYNGYWNCHHFRHQRWHTAFCVLRKECLAPGVPPHLYAYHDDNRQLKVYDEWGRVQDEDIRKGWKFEAIGDKFPRSWIHYNAFSKNKRITFQNVARYHRYRVWMRRGLIPSLGFDGARGRLNRWWGYGIHELFVREFGGVDKAREGSGEFEPWIAVQQRKDGN